MQPTSFSGTCSQHTLQPPSLYTCCCQQNMGLVSTEGHRDRKRAGIPGMPAIFFYLFIFFSTSTTLPLWGIPYPPNYATPSCWTQKMCHLRRIIRFWWLFFRGYLAPSPLQHPYLSPLSLSTCQTQKMHHLWHIFHVWQVERGRGDR